LSRVAQTLLVSNSSIMVSSSVTEISYISLVANSSILTNSFIVALSQVSLVSNSNLFTVLTELGSSTLVSVSSLSVNAKNIDVAFAYLLASSAFSGSPTILTSGVVIFSALVSFAVTGAIVKLGFANLVADSFSTVSGRTDPPSYAHLFSFTSFVASATVVPGVLYPTSSRVREMSVTDRSITALPTKVANNGRYSRPIISTTTVQR
jgi:hypothetical protein